MHTRPQNSRVQKWVPHTAPWTELMKTTVCAFQPCRGFGLLKSNQWEQVHESRQRRLWGTPGSPATAGRGSVSDLFVGTGPMSGSAHRPGAGTTYPWKLLPSVRLWETRGVSEHQLSGYHNAPFNSFLDGFVESESTVYTGFSNWLEGGEIFIMCAHYEVSWATLLYSLQSWKSGSTFAWFQ